MGGGGELVSDTIRLITAVEVHLFNNSLLHKYSYFCIVLAFVIEMKRRVRQTNCSHITSPCQNLTVKYYKLGSSSSYF